VSLEQIPHDRLLECTRRLAKEADGRNTVLLNVYLREIERRKLHLELGFSNLESFFSAELGNYSSPSARPSPSRISRRSRIQLPRTVLASA
jgi:hypothetical protein